MARIYNIHTTIYTHTYTYFSNIHALYIIKHVKHTVLLLNIYVQLMLYTYIKTSKTSRALTQPDIDRARDTDSNI